MRRLPTIEQKNALRDLRIEAGKIIDFENHRRVSGEGDVMYEAKWTNGDWHYELSSTVVIDRKRVTEKFSNPYAETLYFLNVWSSMHDTEEYYTFSSANHNIQLCDDEWEEIEMDDDTTQVELSERLMGYLKTHERPSDDDQAFKDLVMAYAMSESYFYHRLKKRRRRDGSDDRFAKWVLGKYPILDEQTVKDGIERFDKWKSMSN